MRYCLVLRKGKKNWFQFRFACRKGKHKLAWQVIGWGLWFLWTAAALSFVYAFFLGIVTPLVTQKQVAPDIYCARVDYSSPRIRAVDQQSLRIKVSLPILQSHFLLVEKLGISFPSSFSLISHNRLEFYTSTSFFPCNSFLIIQSNFSL